MAEREVLRGGVGNAGRVFREGDRVARPAGPHTPTIHALLRHVRAAGFDGVPDPLTVDPEGREWLAYVPGDVAVPPLPAWVLEDTALASIARLLRRFHDATEGFESTADGRWDTELAEAGAASHADDLVICHNDVCFENVVFRDGEAVALLDFDFAAPGSRWWDVAAFARMCVPTETPEDTRRTGRGDGDPFARLRIVADAYGLPPDRTRLVECLGLQVAEAGAFVQRRVDAGDDAFTAMWHATGGAERYVRRRAWVDDNRQRLLETVNDPSGP